MRHRFAQGISFLLAAICLAPPVDASASPGHNRIVRVVTVSQDMLQGRSPDELVSSTLARLDQAASFHPDMACLPELFPRKPPEAVPGPPPARPSDVRRTHSPHARFGN